MRRKDFSQVECSIARAVDEIGDPWSLLLIRHAFIGARRFADFELGLDIPPTTLSSRLDSLVKKDLLRRRKYEQHPPRYEYELTERALDLLPVIVSLAAWGSRYKAPNGPPLELVDARTGDPIEPVLVDRRTGKAITAGEVGLRVGPGASKTLRRAFASTGRETLVLGAAAASQGEGCA